MPGRQRGWWQENALNQQVVLITKHCVSQTSFGLVWYPIFVYINGTDSLSFDICLHILAVLLLCSSSS